MPIYVYEPTLFLENESINLCCSFEILQALSEEPLKVCPTCGHKIHRAVSTFNVGVSYVLMQSKDDKSNINNTPLAQNAAKIAARHICNGGCKH